MPAVQGGIRFDEIARKWHALAQRRLAYYQDLYRSGRWTHYYNSRQEFAARMLDVIHATRAFAKQAGAATPPRPASEPLSARDDLRPAA